MKITRKETKLDLPFQITARCQDGEYSAKSEYPSAKEAEKAMAFAKRLCISEQPRSHGQRAKHRHN